MEHTISIPEKPETIWDEYVPIIKEDKITNVYLTDEIIDVAEYNKLCYKLLNAAEDELFIMNISTNGGNLDSALTIINALNKTKAYTIAYLTGNVMSAGTIITLACKEVILAPYTAFMCHYYSASAGGKGNEMKQRQLFMDKLLEDMMRNIYEGFLTEEETSSLISGSDFWFTAEETAERFQKQKEVKASLTKHLM